MIQTLWIPGPLPNLNELLDGKARSWRGRKAFTRQNIYNRIKQDWTSRVATFAKAARLYPVQGPIRFIAIWHAESRRLDPDNLAAGGRKVILDGLVKAEIIENDGWKQVSAWQDEFVLVPGKVGVQLFFGPAKDHRENNYPKKT